PPEVCAAAKPAASANSEVPIQAPATPVDKPRARETSGNTKIMTMAQRTTSEIATETCSFLAPTAPATAIEPDTPHTAPACAQDRGQSTVQPQSDGSQVDDAESHERNNGCLHDGHRTGPRDQRQRQAGTEQHNAGLDIKLNAQPRIGPLGDPDRVGDQQPQSQSHQWRLKIVMGSLIPQTQKIKRQRCNVDQ